MAEIRETSVLFKFPEVDEHAQLSVHFERADLPGQQVPLRFTNTVLLSTRGKVILHLRPQFRFPFAVILSAGETNVMTGELATDVLERPQNYFVTPPQGGIDRYLSRGQLRPFAATGLAAEDQMPLGIRVIPVKREAINYLDQKTQLVPGFPPWGDHFLLSEGADRCEPVYEDVSSIGDWDQALAQEVTVMLRTGE